MGRGTEVDQISISRNFPEVEDPENFRQEIVRMTRLEVFVGLEDYNDYSL